MNPNSFSTMWSAVAPALGDHLWQSTLFAAAAALLTLILRKNQARARYWLWLAASLKFLVPFSWLVAIGSRLAWFRLGWFHASSAAANADFYFTVEEISQPFTQSGAAISHAAPATISSNLLHLLPALLASLWLCGFIGVLLMWCVRWRKISAAIRSSMPLREGREVEALRRQERVTGIRQRVEMLLSRATLEPGIFGMARPVLVWPEGISAHLENAHLEAILAHELWHVRRRDNLAAAIHMMVEAIFWFHPLVWWLGARLVDERERACDEEVLESGSERHVYAESILKVCEFCVGSPLACVAGVTGSDLKKRMVHIMSEHVVRKLNFTKKLLLTAAAVATITAPIVLGLVHATPVHATPARAQSQNDAASPRFESFTITPSQPSDSALNPGKQVTKMMFGPSKGFIAANVTLQTMLQDAYGVQANQIVGAPDWLNSERFNVEGKVSPSQVADGASSQSFTVRGPDAPKVGFGPETDVTAVKQMMQAALADSTKLAVHTETRVLPTYVLVVAEGGSKLQPTPAEEPNSTEISNSRFGPRMVNGVRMKENDYGNVMDLQAHGMSVNDLAEHLARQLGQPVINKTGLTGRYDFHLQWSTASQSQEADLSQDGASLAPAISTPVQEQIGLKLAVQEQLGLKLEPQKEPTPVLVIDHIEKPAAEQSENSAPATVSQEAMNGLLLKQVPPDYPETARNAHISGPVVLDAVIGKDGDVENLRIVSGHPLLAPAAIEAVKQWKYQPYLWQGQPIEVQTRLQINFPFSSE
jgi:bla regulator protein blaR1